MIQINKLVNNRHRRLRANTRADGARGPGAFGHADPASAWCKAAELFRSKANKEMRGARGDAATAHEGWAGRANGSTKRSRGEASW